MALQNAIAPLATRSLTRFAKSAFINAPPARNFRITALNAVPTVSTSLHACARMVFLTMDSHQHAVPATTNVNYAKTHQTTALNAPEIGFISRPVNAKAANLIMERLNAKFVHFNATLANRAPLHA